MKKKQVKKLVIMLMVMTIMLFSISFLTVAFADSSIVKVVINDKEISFDEKPFIDENSRTLIPVRFVSEELGATVEWNQEKKEVTITKEDKIIKLIINKKNAFVNDEEIILDTKAILKNSRTFVPVRFISETLGTTVKWDQETQSVLITSDPIQSEEETTIEETEDNFIIPDIEVLTKGEHDRGNYRFRFELKNFDDMKDDYEVKRICTSHEELNSGYYYDRYEIYGEEGWVFRDYTNWIDFRNNNTFLINNGKNRIKPNFEESSYFILKTGETVKYEIYFKNKNTNEIRKYDVEVVMPKEI